jgi:hypothetical protein
MSRAITIRQVVKVLSLSFVLCASTCDKEEVTSNITSEAMSSDTVTFNKTLRDDLPDFSVLQSRADLDTTALTQCKLLLYRATQNVYCWETDTYWKHRVCALNYEDTTDNVGPSRAANKAYKQRMNEFQRWVYEHRDTEQACEIEPAYFEALFGAPTTTSTNQGRQYFTYFFNYTDRWRRSPCPNIYDNPPNQFSYRENPQYFQLCPGVLTVQFGLQDSIFQGLQYF